MTHAPINTLARAAASLMLALGAAIALPACSDSSTVADSDPIIVDPVPDDPVPEIPEVGVPRVAAIDISVPSDPELADVFTKDYYLDALVTIDSNDQGSDLSATAAGVKGRGNSTWGFPKKPYRLKFNKKQALFGMGSAKSYVLLADYIDPTHMRNPVAFAIARMMEMPFTNHFVPATVSFNGQPRGLYLLTEKVGIGSASIDIDPLTGMLFEIDTHFDEPYQFRTPLYQLPVMFKDPDLDERAEESGRPAQEIFDYWQARFGQMEADVQAGDPWRLIDLDSFVDYVLVYAATGNCEIDHPKSIYVYANDEDDTFHFGPVWDFDWAYTYHAGEETEVPTVGMVSHPWIKALVTDSRFLERFGARWNYYTAYVFPRLLEFIDAYAAEIEPYAVADGQMWPAQEGVRAPSEDHAAHVAALKAWLIARTAFVSSAPNFGLLE